MNYKAQHNADLIKAEALRLGFMSCGISKTDYLEEEAPRLEEWLNLGYHGEMKWMENHFDKRLDPRILVPGSKSVVTVLLNYFPDKQQKKEVPKISKYAFGQDYHLVIKDKLKELNEFIQTNIGKVEGRAFVDSAPVMDRAWAKRSGLGWIGKHSLLLTKGAGSFYFIGEMILDLELEPDSPASDHCGECTKCIDSCPTDAIVAPELIDAKKCISYLTIELKNEIPNDFSEQMNNWAFGCDICQDVCPWNKFSKPHNEPKFEPKDELLEMDQKDWMEISQEVFSRVFQKSAVKRTKFQGLQRNLKYIQKTDSK